MKNQIVSTFINWHESAILWGEQIDTNEEDSKWKDCKILSYNDKTNLYNVVMDEKPEQPLDVPRHLLLVENET